MKKKLLIFLILLASVVLMSFVVVACSNSDDKGSTTISSIEGAEISGTDIFMFVESDVDQVSLADKVKCSKGSEWRLFRDVLGQTEIATKIATGLYGKLSNGDNIFYIVVTAGNNLITYTLTVHRSYEVSVNYVNAPNNDYYYDSVVKSDRVFTGTEYTVNNEISITGYTVNGWQNKDGEPVTKFVVWESTNLFVDRTAKKYTAQLDVNGGDTLSTDTIELTYGEQKTLPVPTKTGYNFLGWYVGDKALTGSNGATLSNWTVDEPYNLTAKWTVNYYSLTVQAYDSQAGSVNGSGRFAYGSSVTIRATTKNGYNFIGWYDSNDNLVSQNAEYSFEMSTDTTYIAKWNYYTVSTQTNINEAGTYTVYSNEKVSINQTVNLESVTYLGYTWLGWYNGDEKLTESTTLSFNMPSSNVVYTAKWELKTEFESLIFTSNTTTCSVIGVKDKTVKNVIIAEYVTNISSGIFNGCADIESITIPFIGSGSNNYYPLGYIFGTSSYKGGTAVEQYYFDEGTTFSRYATATYCFPSKLRSVVVTGGNLPYGAFYNCSFLTNIEFPDSLTSIGANAFYNCSSLTSIRIPAGVTSIGSYTFYNCSSLTGIEIPDGVTSIGDYAFYNCSLFPSIEFPEVLKSIGAYAFYNCNLFESLEIPAGVTLIGVRAFNGCSNVESITIPFIGSGSNNYYPFGYIFGTSSYEGGIAVEQYYFDEGTTFSRYTTATFYFPSKLRSVVVTGGNLPYGAFYNCSFLTSIELPNNIASIDTYAFYGCSSFTSITIPVSVVSIGSNVFDNCTALESVYYEGTPEQWASIASNHNLNNATVYYYSENEPADTDNDGVYDGNYWYYDDEKQPKIWRKSSQ